MATLIENLDAFLSDNDFDSQAWSDGGRSEKAEELLQLLSEPDWLLLESICHTRDSAWRACLASILSPTQGKAAEHLLFELAGDEDVEVAFTAISIITFYCGVNDSEEGAFIDLRIRNSNFLSAARAAPDLKKHIRRVSELSALQFQKRFELLLNELER